jgi:hypothetical protein
MSPKLSKKMKYSIDVQEANEVNYNKTHENDKSDDEESNCSFDFEKSKQLVINNREIYKQKSQFINRKIKLNENTHNKH